MTEWSPQVETEIRQRAEAATAAWPHPTMDDGEAIDIIHASAVDVPTLLARLAELDAGMKTLAAEVVRALAKRKIERDRYADLVKAARAWAESDVLDNVHALLAAVDAISPGRGGDHR